MANALFSGALQGLTGMPDPLAPSNVPAPKPAPAAQPTARSAFQESQAAQEQLAKATAEQAQFEGLQAANLAERQARQKERGTEARGRYRETIEAPEIREERTRAEEAASKPFVPTADNVQDLATMFSLISVLGFAIGAGGKTNAIQAMNAMNGMMEGYQQGREDFYLREKDAFEQNAKALKTKIDSLNNKMKEVAQMAAIDLDKANQEADMLFAKEGADFLKQYKDKVGLVATIKMLQEKAKSAEAMYKYIQTEEDKAERARQALADRLALAQYQRGTQVIVQGMREEGKKEGGALPKDKETNNEHRFRFTAMQNVEDVLNELQKPEVRRLIGPTNQYMPDVFLNLQKGYPELAQKLARFQSEEFKTGGKSLTQSEQRILGPIYNWRNMTAGALEDNLNTAIREMYKEQMVLEARYPGLREMTGRYQSAPGITQPQTQRETKSFATEKEAEAAFKAGTLKSGEKVIINGVKGTWE